MNNDPAHEDIVANIQKLRMEHHDCPAVVTAAVRLQAWHEALQMIATGHGDGANDAEVMRGIAQEALARGNH